MTSSKSFSCTVFLLLILLCSGISPCLLAKDGISQVKVSRWNLDPATQEIIYFNFTCPDPCTGTLAVVNLSNQTVAEIPFRGTAKDVQVSWNGRGKDGKAVKADIYVPRIKCKTAKGSTYKFDPLKKPWGDRFQVAALNFDAVDGVLKYFLETPSVMTLHYGLKDGPILGTLMDAVPHDRGWGKKHFAAWDQDRLVRLKGRTDVTMNLFGYSLPSPCFVIDAKQAPFKGSKPAFNARSELAQRDRQDPWIIPVTVKAERQRQGMALRVSVPESWEKQLAKDAITIELFVNLKEQEVLWRKKGTWKAGQEDLFHFFPAGKLPEGEILLTVVVSNNRDQVGLKTVLVK